MRSLIVITDCTKCAASGVHTQKIPLEFDPIIEEAIQLTLNVQSTFLDVVSTTVKTSSP
jgi:hypothetical protein